MLCRRARQPPAPERRHPQRRGPADSGWSRAPSPGPVKTPASSGPATIPGSFASTRTGPKPATTASLCPPGLDPDRLHRRRHLLVQGTAAPPAIRSSTNKRPRSLALQCTRRPGPRPRPRGPSPGRPLRAAFVRSDPHDRPQDWSRSACQSCRRRWESFRHGTHTSTISAAFGTAPPAPRSCRLGAA